MLPPFKVSSLHLSQLFPILMLSFAVLSTDHPMIDINENNDLDTNEEDLSPFHSTVILPVKVSFQQNFNTIFSCSM